MWSILTVQVPENSAESFLVLKGRRMQLGFYLFSWSKTYYCVFLNILRSNKLSSSTSPTSLGHAITVGNTVLTLHDFYSLNVLQALTN